MVNGRLQTNVIICVVLSLVQDLQVVHRTDETKSRFINFAPSVGNDRLSINKPLNSLLTKFLRTDGLNHNCIAGLSGAGLTNPSTNSRCARIEETK